MIPTFYYRGCLKWQDAPNPCRPVLALSTIFFAAGDAFHLLLIRVKPPPIDYVDKSGKATRRGIRVEEVYVYDDGVSSFVPGAFFVCIDHRQNPSEWVL